MRTIPATTYGITVFIYRRACTHVIGRYALCTRHLGVLRYVCLRWASLGYVHKENILNPSKYSLHVPTVSRCRDLWRYCWRFLTPKIFSHFLAVFLPWQRLLKPRILFMYTLFFLSQNITHNDKTKIIFVRYVIVSEWIKKTVYIILFWKKIALDSTLTTRLITRTICFVFTNYFFFSQERIKNLTRVSVIKRSESMCKDFSNDFIK